jgi:hypothetical protein
MPIYANAFTLQATSQRSIVHSNENNTIIETFLCILKSIVGYFILMLIGTNLWGIVVRGLRPTFKRITKENLESIENINNGGSIITILFSIIGVEYFLLLYQYWNIGIMVAGLLLMFARLPDLIIEIRTGKKINSNNMPKRPLNVLLNIFSWLALPLIWYSLCYVK